MNEKLKAILLYPNAKILVDKETCSLQEIDFKNERLILQNRSGERVTAYPQLNCLFIRLRPLSSLTDEENQKLVMMLGDIDGNGNETLSVPAWDIYSDDIITMDYLRSINIDIDGLQERGLCEYE